MIVCHVDVYRSMRVHFLAEADFVRPTDDGGAERTSQATSHIRGYFHMHPAHVSAAYEPQLVDFSAIITELNNAVDQFTCRGSGYVMTRVTKLTAVMVPFNPLISGGGSSYIQTPRRIANKHAVVNVKNLHDNMCFKWAILSALFPATQHADRLSKYVSHKNDIDCSALHFPVDPKQFSDLSAITPALRFPFWRTRRRTSLSLYYTFRHTCIRVRNESAYSC